MKIQTYSSTIRRREMDAVLTCMVEEKTGPGELNARLVSYAKEFFGFSGAVALRSPALALKYALKAMNIPAGEKIMISALAPDWQYQALLDAGYVPLVLDVDETTLLVTADIVSEGAKQGGRVLILHETSGFLPEFEKIIELGIPFIEDISQSAGAVYNEKKAGSFGVFAILGLEQNDLLTAGGGAVLMAAASRDWSALKGLANDAPSTDCLPDINAALGYVQLKELPRNEAVRREMREMYCRSVLQGKHKCVVQLGENVQNAVYSFPVVLSGSVKDVKAYVGKKDIEIAAAFEDSVSARRNNEECEDESVKSCRKANSIALRCVNFPLYPRLGNTQAAKIAKVLSTLP